MIFLKVSRLSDAMGAKTKAGNGSSAIVPKPHQKNHNGCREDDQYNGNGFVETMLGIVFQHDFSTSAVYPFYPAISGQDDNNPYDKVYHHVVRGKPVREKPRR